MTTGLGGCSDSPGDDDGASSGDGGAGPASSAASGGATASSTGAATSTSSGMTCDTTYEAFAGQACAECTSDDCCEESKACAPDSECQETFDCYYDCPFSNTTCWQTCKAMPGDQTLLELWTCQRGSCKSECWFDAYPICDSGFSVIGGPEDVDCASCVSAACCAEYSACFDSQDCQDCYVELTADACGAGELDDAVSTCVTTACSRECDG